MRHNTNILWNSLLLSSTSENMQFTSNPSRLATSLSLVMDIKAWMNMDISNSAQVTMPAVFQ